MGQRHTTKSVILWRDTKGFRRDKVKQDMSRVERNREEKKKSRGIGAWIYRIIILILLGVMGFSGFQLYKIFSEYHEGTEIYESVAEEAGAVVKKEEDNGRLKLDWEALREKNEDIRGWIRLKDTVINYPIVQGTDNSYYLYRTFTKESNGKGSIFIDYRNQNPFKEFNTILYGHRMKDGSMFKPLVEYFNSDGEFYKNHHTIEIYTPDGNYDLEVFACAKIDATDEEWYRIDFSGTEEKTADELKTEYLGRVWASNELAVDTSHISIGDKDNIVSLSTCTKDLDEYRLLIWGKLVKVED